MTALETFPFAPPAAHGVPVEIARNLFWVQLSLPFALDHVNIYLLRDANGWSVIDAGINLPETHAAWRTLFDFIGGPRALKRLVVTHHHVDHLGAAGWLVNETGCEVLISAVEHAAAQQLLAQPAEERHAITVRHLAWLGCPPDEVALLTREPFRPTLYTAPLPPVVRFIAPGERLNLGGRTWALQGGQGHSPAPILLHCEQEALLLAGDQILSSISPFVGTFGDDPLGNPLRDYYAFLDGPVRATPENTLILPGHGRPFRGVGSRLSWLKVHHDERCAKIVAACARRPHSVRELVDVLFTRNLEGVMNLALAETLAHANHLVATGALRAQESQVQAGEVLRLVSL